MKNINSSKIQLKDVKKKVKFYFTGGNTGNTTKKRIRYKYKKPKSFDNVNSIKNIINPNKN